VAGQGHLRDKTHDHSAARLADLSMAITHPGAKMLSRTALSISTLILCSMTARAQTINLWPGTAPGSERWTQKEVTYENTPVGTVVMNVVTPTITAYLPDRKNATGFAVIVVPGGAFVALAMSRGGTDVAQWLQQRGIAAFVLKYRTIEKRGDGIPDMDQDSAAAYGIADGIQALKVVRRHAVEWAVDPARIGMIGFSAGGMVASGVLLQADSASRPRFAAFAYGAPFGAMPKIPRGLPPVFMAWAQDDDISRTFMPRFYDALVGAGTKPEAHIFATGGHGFGMEAQAKASDHWFDDFAQWMHAIGVQP
jgi:acetyl esterase/lipase